MNKKEKVQDLKTLHSYSLLMIQVNVYWVIFKIAKYNIMTSTMNYTNWYVVFL